eukprot:365721-Chlamydomonas_euryale.AAC.16
MRQQQRSAFRCAVRRCPRKRMGAQGATHSLVAAPPRDTPRQPTTEHGRYLRHTARCACVP